MPRPTASHQHPDFQQSAAPGPAHGTLPGNDATNQWLSLHLHRLYGDVIDEPVPERLIKILWGLNDRTVDEPGRPPEKNL